MKKNYKFVSEDTLMVRRRFAEGGDAEIDRFVSDLVKNRKAVGLVKSLKPLDIANVVAKDLGLCPHDAAKATVKIISKIEGLNAPSIETNKEFPVPSSIRRDNTKEESTISKPASKTVWGRPGPDDIPRHHFPPEPLEKEPGDWPYDDMTRAGMKPGNKSRKRPLMTGKEKKKYVFKQDLALNQPGGDGAGGKGIYQTTRTGSGPMPGSGTSWVKQGTAPGWASSPEGEEFDLPESDEEELNIEKEPPVGSPIPQLGYGGRSPGRRMGFRRR